ncbi:MAG: S1C family serine protease [Dehalococcoidia bacterium]
MRHRLYPYLLVLLVVIMLCVTFTACIGEPQANKGTTRSSSTPVSPEIRNGNPSLALELSEDIADIVGKVKPAVIFISATVQTESFSGQPMTSTSSGSGVIIDPAGYALTNNHVVENASKIEVTLPEFQESFKAEAVGTDPLTELAVIKLEGDSFPSASFGDASQLRPGNLVIAIGNPLALEGGSTITLGVVSNIRRSFNIGNSMFYDVIQTDAAINPGNSGGPLVDLRGKIIGINTFIAGSAQNIGFAVSANTAQPVYKDLVSSPHRVIRPWLGVSLADVTPQLAAQEDLFKTSGVFVGYVRQGSPADEAGIKEGDVITAFEGQEITSVTQFLKLLWRDHKPGEEVSITFWRGEDQYTKTVKLGERPENQ